MYNNILTRIRKRKLVLEVFVALMVNLMVFAQPISYVIGNKFIKYDASSNSGGVYLLNNSTNEILPINSFPTYKKERINKKSYILNVENKEAGAFLAFEKKGIIGKSENLPIDEVADNIFTFDLSDNFLNEKNIYLEYEIFGLEDASQATKSINDLPATGGCLVKTNKEWSKVREKIDPNGVQFGKNYIKFTTFENANYQYMVRNLKLVYESNLVKEQLSFTQSNTNSYNGKIAFSGFVKDKTVSKVVASGIEFPVINGTFEIQLNELEPKKEISVHYINDKGEKIENSISINQIIEKADFEHKSKLNYTQVNKLFEKDQVNNLSLEGAKIEADKNSLTANKTFSIAGLRYVDVPTLSPEMVNVTSDFYGYRMLPHGEHFTNAPARIHLKYDEKKLPTGYTAKDIKTFYFDLEQKKWLALEKDTLLSTTQEIVSKTTHFTDFINGIIKVPESPETGSYTPTSIKDIKAADPVAGVVSIAPPTPNNMGTLNTSFPIKLPAGRSGMEPELAVSYSSDGGNGWMGLGWDLSIPGVSLDTKWGAPRYGDVDGNGSFDNIETEIYTLGGGTLTFKDGSEYTNPHRKGNIAAQAERQFYPRIEGSYAKIIRHGNNPTNYWWEVTDKTGNKSFYGGYTGGVVNNAVVKTNGGNIAYWGLYRTEDTNGNYVEYIYENQSVSLPGRPGDNGNEFFIKEIKYTLHSSAQDNYYKVSFNKSNNYNVGTPSTSNDRPDVQVNARNGVVQVTKDLLREIKVSFEQPGNSQTIRTYRFDYETHTFVKSQLTKIAEYDASGDLFYSNTMEYHNKDEAGNVINENNFIDSNESTMWNHDDDNIKGDLLLGSLAAGISNEFTNQGSALGSTKGWGLNGGLYVGFGIPCSGSNLFTAGVNGGYSYSESKGLISFMDVNGDGLPDKIYRKDGQIKFRPNLGLPGSTVGFGAPQDITGINQLSETTSDSKSVGLQASFFVFAGYTYNTSKSVTKTYFSDVNGDGLIDLVDNGSVKFNHTLNTSYLNSASFSPDNSLTQNPVGSGPISTTVTNNVTLETMDQLRDENPQHDIVKIWTAPKEGTISITGDNVILDPIVPSPSGVFPSSSTDPYFNDYDGVRFSIQKNNSTFPGTIIKEGTISPTFSGAATVSNTQVDMNISSLSVAKGDRLYFRVQAKEEGTFDRVKWDPIITYSGTNETNVDGISYYSSAASEGFILSAKDVVAMSQNGTITMDWNTALSTITPYTFSDNLTFAIEKGNIDPTTGVFSVINTYYADVNQSIFNNLTLSSFDDGFGNSIPLSVVANNGFRFSVTSSSNVNWKAIKWEPRIILSPSAGGNDIISYPVVEYGIYNKKINEVLSKVNGLNNTGIVVRPVFDPNAFNSLADGNYFFNIVVKNSNKKVLASQNIIVTVDSSNLSTPVTVNGNDDISIVNDVTSTIYVEYFTSNLDAANIGALASEPITAQIYQSSNTTAVTALTAPTGVNCSARWIKDIHFNGVLTALNTCFPNYLQINVPAKNVIRNTTYNLTVNLNGSARAAVWIDWNKSTAVDPGEYYNLTASSNISHNLNILVPVTALEGEINVRVLGGATLAPYTTTNFYTNPVGSVRDFKINVVSLKDTTKDIYCKIGNNEFGPNYRNWGHFAYHGGIVIKRGVDLNGDGLINTQQERRAVVLVGGNPVIIANYGIDPVTNAIIPIDENALITNTSNPMGSCNGLSGQALIDCLQANSTQTATSTRFISLTPNEEFNIWFGSSKEVSVDENHFSTSRMGVKNIKTIYVQAPTGGSTSTSSCDFPAISGISLINKGEGDSFSVGGSVGGVGGSLNTSTSFNWAELNYMDLNGDRYPDILTKDNVQFTNSLGALSETRNLGFGRVSTGETSSYGAGASGSFTVATTPGTYLSFNLPIFGGIGPIIIPITAPKVKASVGINANVGTGGNTEKTLWADMNGDGLSDRINMDGGIKVALNLGYGLDAEKIWVNGTNELSGTQTNFSGGAGYTYGDYAWGGGISLSASRAYTQSNLADINGDGLPDLILNNDSAILSYRINTGNGFDSNTYNNSGYISFNRSVAEGVNAAFSIPIPIQLVLICFQIIINPSVGGEQTLNRTENSLDDINGDGFMDILNGGNGSTNDGYLKARLSKIGKTNLLRKVNTPTGGSWEVAYERAGNTFEFAQSKYVLSAIKIFDAFTADNNWSNDRVLTSVEYEKPYFDRREREFFGFEKVKINQHGGFNTDINIQAASITLPNVYRYSVQEYHNKNYYLKGAVKKESLFDENNVVWTENKTTYGIYLPDTALTTSILRPSGFNDTNYSTAVDVDAVNYGSGVNHISSNVNFICTTLDKGRLFVTPIVSVKTFTEGQALGSNNKYVVTIMESIDAHGNVTQFRDYGEQGTDVYVSKIQYTPISAIENGYGFPNKIQVFDADGTTLKRERTAQYNASGDQERVITKLNATEDASVKMEYDTFGNLSKVINENSLDASGNQYFRAYTYDDVLHTFPTNITDAFGYTSSITYNYLFGVPVYNVDMNMQPMRTRIDDRGRQIEITGPYELFVEGVTGGSEIGWTIRFEYQGETPVATKVNGASIDDDSYTKVYNGNGSFQAIIPDNNDNNDPTNSLCHALTRHFDPEYRADEQSVTTANQILTSTLSDGFGKPIQVKKMFARHLAATSGNVPNTTNNAIEWLLAGKVKQDAFGRSIESYYPTTQTDNFTNLSTNISYIPANAFVYDNSSDAVEPSMATFDVLDRGLTTKLPGETEETVMEYKIENNQFLTIVTNELGQVQKSYTDIKGRTTETLEESVTGDILTTFEYNNLSELLKVTDVANNITTSSYDLAGRRLELRHPDNGITQFVYDRASNMIERKTSNLLYAGQSIEYKYTYNRLEEIKYPQNPENNVHYYYGTAGNSDAANDNAVGRLWYHVDATGTQYMKYGRLGELTLNRRSVAVPGDRVYWFQTEWTYDTWNRVKTIKYPDQELITYKYNKGGELHAMISEKNGTPNKDIISQLGYDKFGQRVYLRYGNGTETTYNYQAERRRLDRMKVQSNTTYGAASTRQFVNNKYNYDALSNVLSIQNNTVAMPTTNQIGGRSWQEFTYDDLNRLTTASGNFVGRNDNGVGYNHSKYTMAMSYDSQHNIINKIQNHETAVSTSPTAVAGTWTQVEQTSYSLNYQDYNTADYNVAGYEYNQPHAPRKIVDQPTLPGCCDPATDVRVKTKTFEYDRNGNQTKVTSKICTSDTVEIIRENLWDEENRLRAIDLNPEANTIHPIAIYTYDAGGDRVIKQNATSVAIYENAKQVGTAIKSDFMLYPSGMLVARPAADGTGALSYTKHYFAGTQRVSSKIGSTTNLGKFLQDWTLIENSSGGAPINLVSTSHDQLTTAETGVTHVYTQFEITPTPTFNSNTAFLPVSSFTETGTETEAYWFHPDHLGSSSYITNFTGEVSQHMEYFAFGETFIEEHKNSHNSPFKFNGKELDEESGLYYYGARYYDPRLSLWTATDPLSGFNPIFEVDHYFDGDHNGGIYNSFNHATYSYCYQNPIKLIDPNGKQVKSEYLGSFSTNSSMFNGIVDGFIDSIPGIGALKEIYKLTTNGEYRAQLFAMIKKIAADPAEFLKTVAKDKYEAYKAVLSGGGTDQQRYDVGNDLGGLLFGLISGGVALKVLKDMKKPSVKTTIKKLCFVEGTLVLTINGFKKIEEVEVGDKVWSFNEQTLEIEIKEVVSLSQNTTKELIEVSIENEKIVCTPEHPFFVANTWVEAKDLNVGDKLSLKDGKFVSISSINKFDETVKVYNFEVAGNHNYYVSELEVLVHNNCNIDMAATLSKIKSHSFSAKHIKAGVMDLGSSIDDISNKTMSVISRNTSKLVEGSNDIVTKMNGHTATIRVFVKDNKVISGNVFKGTSGRNVNNLIKE